MKERNAASTLEPDKVIFEGYGEYALHGYRLAAPGESSQAGEEPQPARQARQPRLVALFVHGMAEHGRRYRDTAQQLAAIGAVSYSYDLRGHGAAATQAGSLGHIADSDGFSVLVRDLVRVIDRLRFEHPALPLVLFGQSMGSLIIRDYLARYADHAARIDAVILSGTVGPPGLAAYPGLGYALALRRLRGARSPSAELDRLTFGAYSRRFRPLRTGFDWLSRDPVSVDAYVDDPLCGFICSIGFYVDLLKAALRTNSRRAAQRTPIAVPMLLISGVEDPVGGFGRGVKRVAERYRRAGVRSVTLELYAGARHELYHETNRQQVWDAVARWLAKEGI